MELFFLGNGGGRVVLDRQMLPTGGFRINSGKLRIHADPGPGAFLKSFQHRQDPKELTAIFCSHAHIDHCHDANMLIEAMNFGNFKGGKGVLLGSESVVNGYQKFEKQIDEYFKGMLKECIAMKAGDTHNFPEKNTFNATKTFHEDPSGIGFILESEGVKLGYTSDTGYFDGIAAQYEGCDFLIVNCLRPNNDLLEFHLTSSEVIKFVNEMVRKPRAIILTHIGMKFLQAGPEAQRKLVEEKTGVQTLLAGEGLSLNLSEMKKQATLV
ncbi:MAG TPA: MBL fold metallo-hydrolase [Candidatus Norongarragalinales archaeon]|nr:MBL fold metallo-hydrolase [Candidatus Norongarragalinales archaeon]